MPARSLRSPVLKWPDRPAVEAALGAWLAEELRVHPEVRRFGFFGSYATNTWGPGSDLDLVAVIDDGPRVPAFTERASSWPIERLPVPADLLVYSESEWRHLTERKGTFARMMNTGVVWVYIGRGPRDGGTTRPA